MVTGLRPKSFQNMQLNAGVFLEGFDWREAESVDALETLILEALEAEIGVLGATVGDGTFTCVPESREIEVNDMRYPVVGSTVFDRYDVHLTGTLKEITPDNVKRVLPTAMEEEGSREGVTVIQVETDLHNDKYIPKLCWVGDTSNHGFILIELDNALNVSGMNLTFTSMGEGTLPFDFKAHCGSLKDMKYAPCRIVFFDKAAEAEALENGEVESDE